MDNDRSTDASKPAPAPEVHAAQGAVAKKKLFLSRSSADVAVARKLIPALQALGYEVWAQDHSILTGDDFRKWMDTALLKTDATVALLSGAYLASEWCRDEAVSAHRQSGRRLVPLLIEEGCEPDGLIASFVWLDVAVKMSGAAADVAALVDQVLTEGKPLEESAAARDYLRRGDFVSNIELNENYVLAGREDETAQLEQMLGQEGAEVALTAVNGMGGVGKSYLARVWAVRHRMKYRGIWMVRAEQPVEMVEDLADLGGDLIPELQGVADKQAAAQAALAKLADGGSGRPFLLIYDNVENPDVLRDWRPKAGCRVLVTSRWGDWTGTGAAALKLEKLSPEGAVALLREYGTNLSDEDAGRIAEELDFLPLALTQAAAVIRRSGLNAEEYLQDLQRRIGEIPRSSGEYEKSTRAALESNIEQVRREKAGAPALLELAAFYAPEAIPLELWTTQEARTVLPEALHDEVALKEAFGALESFSLLGVDRDDPVGWTVSVHRLVQAVTRAGLEEAGRFGEVVQAAIGSARALYPFDSDDVRFWPVCGRLQSHAEMALSRVLDTDAPAAVGSLLNQCGLYRKSRAEYAAAELLYRRALEISEASYGAEHPTVATRLNNLASLLQATNCLAEAEPLMRRALSIDEASYGAEHANVATDLNNLAQLLQATNRLAEAEPLMRRALSIDEASYGAEHPTVAIRLNNLASLLQATNRLAEAEPLMRRALSIDEACYGAEHPEVATDLNNLAQLLKATNRLAEAEPLMRRALSIDETSYGAEHPTVAIRLNNLAQLLQATSRLEEAEPLMCRALSILEGSLPDGHPYVEGTRRNLGALLEKKAGAGSLADDSGEGDKPGWNGASLAIVGGVVGVALAALGWALTIGRETVAGWLG